MPIAFALAIPLILGEAFVVVMFLTRGILVAQATVDIFDAVRLFCYDLLACSLFNAVDPAGSFTEGTFCFSRKRQANHQQGGKGQAAGDYDDKAFVPFQCRKFIID